jgi:integrase/recombinase XerD
MANDSSFEADWHRYPLTSVHTDAKRWIQSCVMLGLASNTIVAYGRGIEGFLAFCQTRSIDVAAHRGK